MQIVLADDHAMVRDGLIPFIERVEPGMQVLPAGTLGEALTAAASAECLTMIILDLNMPGMNGFSGLAAARQAHPQIPVVILSGSTQPSDAFHAIENGAGGYIPKTMRGETIIGVLRLILSGEKYVPPFLFDYREEISRSGHAPIACDKNAMTDALTPRELDILTMIVDGAPNKVIARALDLQEVTVKAHLRNIFRKISVKNRTEAARAAMLAGLSGSQK